jgi:predicted nuclease of predicted toxin-antitoxin system
MARLYANENFPFPTVECLRRSGHDVLTVQETGKADQQTEDTAILEWARAESRAVLTINRKHFVRLHRQQPTHCGIIVCSFDHDFEGQAERIGAAIASTGDLRGQLIRVNRPG